jgi:hypothetical protein
MEKIMRATSVMTAPPTNHDASQTRENSGPIFMKKTPAMRRPVANSQPSISRDRIWLTLLSAFTV